MSLTGVWVGHISGTNIGLLNARLSQEGERFSGELVLDDSQHGRTILKIEGGIEGRRIKGELAEFRGSAPIIPTSGSIVGEVSPDGSQLIGQWNTNIGTGGKLMLDKESASSKLSIEVASGGVTKSASEPIIKSLVVDFKNIPIEPFCASVEDLKELARVLAAASNKAKALEEQLIKERYQALEQQRLRLANIPGATIEIIGVDGKFILVSSPDSFSTSLVPADLKSIRFYSYKQDGYMPSHGLQIRIENVNGSDTKNPQGFISVHGEDTTWVEGTFASVKQFFSRRKSQRAWLHKPATGQLVLYGFVFPLALWVLFRGAAVFPRPFREIPLLNIGVFVYVYLGLYYVFDKLLRYLRWTMPLYEIQSSAPDTRHNHRRFAWTLFASILAAFLYDFVKILLVYGDR